MEISKILPVSGGGGLRVGVRLHDVFLGDCGVVANPLEMFFIGGFEMLLSLGDFDHVGGDLPVFIGEVGEISLLIEGVGPVVAGAV